jgi:DNA-binding transcriptional LysR family regulator
MGFVPLPVVELDPAIELEPVREVELMVALPPGHRLAKQHRPALRKLAHEPFVMLKRSSATCCTTGFPVYAARPASSRRLFNSPKAREDSFEWPPAWRGALPGYARFPSDVVFRPLPVTTPKFRLSLAWRRDNESPLLKTFLEILRTRLGKASR